MTGILFAGLGIGIPHVQSTTKMICDCNFIKLTQREMYGTAEFGLVGPSTGAPASYDILLYPNEAMLLFTRYLLIIDCIPSSSL